MATRTTRGGSNLKFRTLLIVALVVVVASCGEFEPVRPLLGDRPLDPTGAVTAEDLSAAFIDDPCAALARYNDRWWRVSGAVEPRDRWGRWPLTAIPLTGGVHASSGRTCQGVVLFPDEFAEEAVLVERDAISGDVPLVVDLVCRIGLSGFGTLEYSPQIWARDCEAPAE